MLPTALCARPGPDTYSHVLLSLATTDAAKTSRVAVGSISAIVLPRARKPADLTKLWGVPANQQGHGPPPPQSGLWGGGALGHPAAWADLLGSPALGPQTQPASAFLSPVRSHLT